MRRWIPTILIAVAGLAIGGVLGFALRGRDPGYSSVAFLVHALGEEGLACEGGISVQVSHLTADEPFETGSCKTFANDDQGDFYTFRDGDDVEQWLQTIGASRSGGVSGVVGENWVVSVRLEATARAVQAAIGGELMGY